MDQQAHVMVAMGISKNDGLSLVVKSIVVYNTRVEETVLSEVFFEWFVSTGHSYPAAHENAVSDIASFIKSHPDLRKPIMNALAPALFLDVERALGEDRW